TIQDCGRTGFASWGINPGGAMDRYASEVSNILAGNESHLALIEIHFPAPQILFQQTALIAITGADFTPLLNDQPVSLWQPLLVRRNTILQFSQWKQGARCYLAIHGGLSVKKWLNSYSTNTKALAGGLQGRRLEKGDEIKFGESKIYYAGLLKQGKDVQSLGWKACVRKIYDRPNEIYFITGHEWKVVDEISKQLILNESFAIQSLSDRMGYHLKGTSLALTEHKELLSSGVSFGTMQLLPNGQLIILMADHQTTGGYPRIGHVISAHLPKLAQLRPGDEVRFKLTDVQTAEHLYSLQQQDLSILKRSCSCNLNKITC
ncbi:MAG: 5-oxoprolinase subunit C family protein, partial [Flavitalea sp.]